MTSAPSDRKVVKEAVSSESQQYVGPYRLEKTLGKGQTGMEHALIFFLCPAYDLAGTWTSIKCAAPCNFIKKKF
jgi:hypothetical protein